MEKANDQATNNGVTQQEVNEDQQDDVDLDEDAQATERLTDSDPSKVKFTSIKMDGYGPDKNGDARVDIRVVQASVGMGKEELMKYANEPYWVRLRMILFVLFWVSWVAMLVGAVAIIMLAPRCPPAPRLQWHQKSMYRVMLSSFKDSDNDGIGDLNGLKSKLDYLKDLNIVTILLSSFYEMASNSDGIVNHTSIDKRFGTMTDFEELLKAVEERDMKLVIDFNPNHSSDQHPWFQASIKEEEPYTDYYVWAKELDVGKLPNNWLNVKSESAWVWNEGKKEYYLNTFGRGKPELNLRKELVKNELEEIMRFWLDKGVHGFMVIAASNLVEDANLRDEPLQISQTTTNRTYQDVSHTYTVGHPENLELFAEWRKIVDNYTGSSFDSHRILLAEVSESVNSSMRYYGNATDPLADFPINVQLTRLKANSSATDIFNLMTEWLVAMPRDMWPNWQLGSEHVDRLATRVGDELLDAMQMIAAVGKGTPIMYYGDELGIKYEPIEGRVTDINQSPMQWNSELQGGFSNGTDPIFPLNTDYQTVNVEVQEAADKSHLKIFKTLMADRKLPAIELGIQEVPVINENIFSLLRVQKGAPGFILVVNVGNTTIETDFSGKSDYLPAKGRIEVSSLGSTESEHPQVQFSKIALDPKQAAVFTFVPVFKD